MSKNTKIILAVVAVLSLSGVSFAVWHYIIKPRREATAALKNVPKDSFLVAEFHIKQAMQVSAMKNALSLPEVQKALGDFKAKCGFDPSTKIDDLYLAVRGVQNKPQIGVVLRGSFSQTEVDNCLKLYNTDNKAVPGAAIGGHPTYTLAGGGFGRRKSEAVAYPRGLGQTPPSVPTTEPVDPDDQMVFALGNNTITMGHPSWIGELVKVADGQGEGADKNDGLFAVRKMFRGNPTVVVTFDAKSFQSGMPEIWDSAMKGMRNPMVAGMLGKLASMVGGGYAMTVDGDTVRFTMLLKLGSRSDASDMVSTLDGLMGMAKAFTAGGFTREQTRTQSKIDRLSATKPELKAQMQPSLLKYPVLTKIISGLKFTKDGDSVRLDIELSNAELNNLIEALKADNVIKEAERAEWDHPVYPTPGTPTPLQD